MIGEHAGGISASSEAVLRWYPVSPIADISSLDEVGRFSSSLRSLLATRYRRSLRRPLQLCNTSCQGRVLLDECRP